MTLGAPVRAGAQVAAGYFFSAGFDSILSDFSIFSAFLAGAAFTITDDAIILPASSVYLTWTESPALTSAAVIALPPFLIVVLESTPNVHSSSLPFILPATPRLSADAGFTVPLADLAAGFFSAFFSILASDFISDFFSSAFFSWATAS